jgi:protein-S-isoprenylcysteine O-methyltransferase Ste14
MEQLQTAAKALAVILVLGSFIVGAAFIVSAEAALHRPRQPRRLVTTGPFALTRNPIYVGLAFVYVGVAASLDLLWAILALPLVLIAVDQLVVAREEHRLADRFGDDYHHYVATTPRWVLARWRAR